MLLVVKRMPLMREATLSQLKKLISILGQCLMSLHSDFMKFDCNWTNPMEELSKINSDGAKAGIFGLMYLIQIHLDTI